MKTIEYYMNLKYRMEVVPDTHEGGYIVRFPDLPGCITCADTPEEALKNAEDCKRAWFEAALEEGITIPEPSDEESCICLLK